MTNRPLRLPDAPPRYDQADQDNVRRLLTSIFQQANVPIESAPPADFSSLTINPGPLIVGTADPGGAEEVRVLGSIRATSQLVLSLVTGTAPMVVASQTMVANLNADLVDGLHAAAFALVGSPNTFSGLQTFGGGISIPDGQTITFVGGLAGDALNMNNHGIVGANYLKIADPGPNEGVQWLGGNLWQIYESPNDLTTNTGGNLQIVQNTTRRATFNTSGQLELPIAIGTAPLLITSTTLVANLNADLLDSQDGAFYQNASNLNAGNLAYARLPTGGGTWANGGTLSITGGVTTVAGLVSSADITAQARLVFSTAAGKIVPGATSLSLRNNADAADNLLIADNGAITIRNSLSSTGGVTLAAGNTAKILIDGTDGTLASGEIGFAENVGELWIGARSLIRLLMDDDASGTGSVLIQKGTQAAPTTLWTFDINGHLTAATDNTQDIGASGATRPRTLYLGTSALIGTIASGGLRAYYGSSDGVTTASDIRASSSNNLIVSAAAGGDLFLNFDHGNLVRIAGTGVRFESDSTIDIGAAGANRPRDLFLGRDLTMNGTLTLVSGVVRLPDPADLSLASTTHAFQIGATAGQNLAMDSNEIMARNNGVAATLNINIEGGNVAFGGSLLPAAANGGAIGSATLPFGAIDVNTMRVRDTSNNIRASIVDSGGSTGFELGRQDGTGGTAAFMDFHSGATVVDYDARLIGQGGTGVIAGGSLTAIAGAFIYQSTSGNTRFTFADTVHTTTVPLKFNTVNGKILGGSTDFSHRNNADSADNLLIVDAGDATFRTKVTLPGPLVLTTAVSKVVPGATSLSLRNNADSADNILIADAGAITFRGGLSGITTLSLSGAQSGGTTLSLAGPITLTTAASKIIPGATSLALRNNADNANNLLLTDAGVATLRNDLIIGSLGLFDSTDAPLDGQILFYHGGGTNKWQAESFQLIYNSGDAQVAVNVDSTSVQFVYLDPGAGSDSPAGAPPAPVLKLFPYHKGVTVVAYASTGPDIEYHDGASFPADFRHIIYEYSLDNFGTAAKALATASGDKVNHGRLTPGTTYYYRARAVDRAGNASANSPVVSFVATANSDTSNFGIVLATEIAVDRLAAISANIGIITAGQLRNSGNTAGVNLGGAGGIPGTWTSGVNFEAAAGSGSMTRYINFTATGANPFIKHELLSLNADGTAVFNGVARDTASKFTIDFSSGSARLLTIIDEQGTPRTRVKLGEVNAGTADWGLQVFADNGNKIVELTGAALFIQDSAVTPTRGINIQGTRPASWTDFIDLVGSGSGAVFQFGKVTILANGSLQFIPSGNDTSGFMQILGQRNMTSGADAATIEYGTQLSFSAAGSPHSYFRIDPVLAGGGGSLTEWRTIEFLPGTVTTPVTDYYTQKLIQPAVVSSAITNLYGIYIGNHSNGATLNYALYTNTGLIRFGDDIVMGAAAARIRGGATSFAVRNNANSADNLIILDAGDATFRTKITLPGPVVFTTAASKIVPGATSISHRNNADSADNLIILDAGDATFRTKITLPGPVVFTTAASKIIPGATSISHRNNADSADNLIILDAGDATFRTKITLPGPVVFTTAASKIVPGATSLSHRNNADSADNLIILDAGDATFRTKITLPGPVVFTTAASKIVPGATSLSLRNTADSADNLIILDAGDATFRTFIDMNEMAAPATPAANKTRDYSKDASGVSKRYWKDDAGVEHPHNLTLIDSQTFTANGTWTKPAGAVLVRVEVIGGGGGGGGGRGGAVGSARNGGGGGGGGARTQRWWEAADLGATETLVVGGGGTAGTGGSAADGTDGGAGGNSSFGTTAIQWAFGGGGGARGNAVLNGNTGGSGGGSMDAGQLGNTTPATVLGGSPRSSVAGDGEGYGGATAEVIAGSGQHGRPAAWGGASGGAGDGWSGGVSAYGGGGGGGGGAVTAANVQQGGGDGGGVGSGRIQGGGGGGAGGGPNAGAAGANGDSKFSGKGGGGGGGNSNSAGPNGGAGGAGGTAGGGGGGGGGGTTVGAGGAGGVGGRGEVRVYTYA